MQGKLYNFSVTRFLSVLALVFFISCQEQSEKEGLLLTVVQKESESKESAWLESYGLISKARIVSYSNSEDENSTRSLTQDFYSASHPNVHFNGKSMVFSGQKKDADVWQIYEMNLDGSDLSQLTESNTNCLSPVYLPDGSIVFSKEIQENEVNEFALFKLNSEKQKEERITFTPGSYFVLSTLHDGRIICAKTGAGKNDQSDRKLFVMRPDGSKEMLFSESEREFTRSGVESTDRSVYLFESDLNENGSVYILNYNDPLHSKRILSEKVSNGILAMSLRAPDQLVVSLEDSEMTEEGVYEFNIKDESLVGPVFRDIKLKVIGITAVQKREVPKKIPSEVNLNEETALLLCQDAGFYGFQAEGSETRKAIKLEVIGKNSSMGIVDLEADGSVYLKLRADTPFRLQTLDAENNIVNGPSSWINLRPNERRACTGCHQGTDRVPDNRQPLAVTKEPVSIPRVNELLAKQD
ncbi:hypothetical protein [Lutimonas zeaxanthinifaciens]|uniref:HzsA-related protein n=1 Tax=Lutimonas zeaxanthinifaciens TaxID=3060215 RepID=UPI00265CEB4F|nr:hypothetical protein [Lutimonas sp. YSD2104]WKK66669.1 hypothetical protein QZH61_03395 [Lutimonas sp. YSD2104]